MPTRVPDFPRVICAAPHWPAVAAALPALPTLADRETGLGVVAHRSSWVRRVPRPAGDVYVKTYEYASWGDRLRNWTRWTAPWRPSRARREFQALAWLRAHGFEGPEPLACFELRRFGFLVRATLVTAAFAGEPADRALAAADEMRRLAIATSIGALVAALHRSGFRDGNLDLRNLLVRSGEGTPTVAKIDSPRHRLVRPGAGHDRLARADWDRLLPQLAPFGLAEATLRAAGRMPTA